MRLVLVERERSMLKHILSGEDFDLKLIDQVYDYALKFEKLVRQGIELPQTLQDRVFDLMMFEPSTRTKDSNFSAICRLGGSCTVIDDWSKTSMAKGETLSDMMADISINFDGVVVRHKEDGFAEKIAKYSKVPIINAGDGKRRHPTQSLLDIVTIRREIGHIDGLKIAIVGDLKFGRTVHSLLEILGLYKNIEIFLISPPEFALDDHQYLEGADNSIKIHEIDNLEEALSYVNVVYATRYQWERLPEDDKPSTEEIARVENQFRIDRKALTLMSSSSIVMHPFPRREEIDRKIDDDRRAAYFRQMWNGLITRLALFHLMYEGKDHALGCPYPINRQKYGEERQN